MTYRDRRRFHQSSMPLMPYQTSTKPMNPVKTKFAVPNKRPLWYG